MQLGETHIRVRGTNGWIIFLPNPNDPDGKAYFYSSHALIPTTKVYWGQFVYYVAESKFYLLKQHLPFETLEEAWECTKLHMVRSVQYHSEPKRSWKEIIQEQKDASLL